MNCTVPLRGIGHTCRAYVGIGRGHSGHEWANLIRLDRGICYAMRNSRIFLALVWACALTSAAWGGVTIGGDLEAGNGERNRLYMNDAELLTLPGWFAHDEFPALVHYLFSPDRPANLLAVWQIHVQDTTREFYCLMDIGGVQEHLVPCTLVNDQWAEDSADVPEWDSVTHDADGVPGFVAPADTTIFAIFGKNPVGAILAIPEPATLSLLLAGGIVLLRRRRYHLQQEPQRKTRCNPTRRGRQPDRRITRPWTSCDASWPCWWSPCIRNR